MKNKKFLSVLLVFVMVIVSLPVVALASEPFQGDNVAVYTQEDGITEAVDIDEFLEELFAYSRGQQSCDDLDLLIYRVMNHQLSGEPLYVTTWYIYDGQDTSERSPAQTRVQAIPVESGVLWRIDNISPRTIDTFAIGRLYSFGRFQGGLSGGNQISANHFIVMPLEFALFWDRSTLDLWTEGQHRFFDFGRF